MQVNLTHYVMGSDKPICNVCCRPTDDPFRSRDRDGRIVQGCVSAAHEGMLSGDSLAWHESDSAKRCRDLFAAHVASL